MSVMMYHFQTSFRDGQCLCTVLYKQWKCNRCVLVFQGDMNACITTSHSSWPQLKYNWTSQACPSGLYCCQLASFLLPLHSSHTHTPSHYLLEPSQPCICTNSEPFQQTTLSCVSAHYLQILALMQNALGIDKWRWRWVSVILTPWTLAT